jgi:hypothetical protein
VNCRLLTSVEFCGSDPETWFSLHSVWRMLFAVCSCHVIVFSLLLSSNILFLHFMQGNLAQAVTALILIRKVSLSNLLASVTRTFDLLASVTRTFDFYCLISVLALHPTLALSPIPSPFISAFSHNCIPLTLPYSPLCIPIMLPLCFCYLSRSTFQVLFLFCTSILYLFVWTILYFNLLLRNSSKGKG